MRLGPPSWQYQSARLLRIISSVSRLNGCGCHRECSEPTVALRSSMPNNSASSSVSTTAAQLTATNGRRPAPAQLVDLACDEFLASPTFALKRS
jgi:hypothetical protein